MECNDRKVIIAEADSFWTKRFVEYVLKPLNQDITIISPKNTQNSEYYIQNRIIYGLSKGFCRCLAE